MPAKNSEFIPRFVHDRKQPKFLDLSSFSQKFSVNCVIFFENTCSTNHFSWQKSELHFFHKTRKRRSPTQTPFCEHGLNSWNVFWSLFTTLSHFIPMATDVITETMSFKPTWTTVIIILDIFMLLLMMQLFSASNSVYKHWVIWSLSWQKVNKNHHLIRNYIFHKSLRYLFKSFH